MKNLIERKEFVKNETLNENNSIPFNNVKILDGDEKVLRFEDFVRQKKTR